MVSENGCSASSFVSTATVLPSPTLSLLAFTNPSSCGANDGSIFVNGGTGGGTLTWSGTSSGSMMNTTLPAMITGLTAGAYSISFDNGCLSNNLSVSVSDPGAPAVPNITADNSTTLCNGQSLNITSDVASGLTWSTGASSQTINVTANGTYFVTVSNGACSATSAPIVVEFLTSPIVNAGQDMSVCDGEFVTLAGSGALTYTWDNGVTNNLIFAPLSTATYTVTGTDQNGCSSTDQVIVTVKNLPNTPVITLSTDADICETETLVMTSSLANGIIWSTGETSQNISVNTGGEYFVTKTGANGCTANSDTVTVTVSVNMLVQANATDTEICAGDTVILSANGSPSGLLWLPMNVAGSSVEVMPTATTDYTVQLTNGACVNQDVITITVNQLPIVDAGSDFGVCNHLPFSVSASGALTYQWDHGITDGVSYYQFELGLQDGTTILTVVGTDVNGCKNSDMLLLSLFQCESIDENSTSLVKVYPNPSTGIFTISSENLADYKTVIVKDNLGRIVSESSLTSDSINLSELANGKYYLILTGEKQLVTPIEIMK